MSDLKLKIDLAVSRNPLNIMHEMENYKNTLNANQYRFDKSSNFVSYDEWEKIKLNAKVKELVETNRIIALFKDTSDEDLYNFFKDLHTGSNLSKADEYNKLKYFDAVEELKRRTIL